MSYAQWGAFRGLEPNAQAAVGARGRDCNGTLLNSRFRARPDLSE